MTTIFDELDFLETLDGVAELFSAELMEQELDNLFNNDYENKSYILTGSIGLWDGVRQGHSCTKYNSIKEAIYGATDGFGMCYITVTEKKYGRLFIDVCHHDGNNHLEIREVTALGEDVLSRHNDDIDMIVNRKAATKNIKFLKNYW